MNKYKVVYFINVTGIVRNLDASFIDYEDAEEFLTKQKSKEGYLYGAILRYDPFEVDKRYRWKVV